MSKAKRLEFFVLRYAVEDVGSINLGVVLLDSTAPAGYCQVRFTRDWQRILSFDPDADVEMLEALICEIEENLQSPELRDQMVRTMESSFSNAVRISHREACRTNNPNVELARLARLHLGESLRSKGSLNRPHRILSESEPFS
jgi:hypothetical protein